MKKVLMAGGVAVLLLGIIWFVLRSPTPPQPIQFPDGSELNYLGATYGTNHVYSFRSNPWQLVLGYLPATWFPNVRRAAVLKSFDREPHLMLWFLMKNAPVSQQSMQYSIRFPGEKAEGTEEIYSEIIHFNNTSTHVAPNSQLVGARIPVFPRRGADFILRMYQYDAQYKPQLAGEMVIVNPVKETFPEWKPERLPVTKNDRGFSATLTRVVANASADGEGLHVATRGQSARTYLSFRIEENGKSTGDWGINGVEQSDATGNKSSGGGLSSEETKEGENVLADRVLFPEETWKLKVEFCRERNFSSEELVTFESVPVLDPGKFRETDLVEAQGVKIRWRGITVPGAKFSKSPSIDPRCFAMHVEVMQNPPGYHLRVVKCLADDQTQVLTSGYSESEGMYSFLLREGFERKKTKTLSITFALTKSRSLEFVVKPEVLPTHEVTKRSP